MEAVDEAYQNLVLARTNVEILDRLVKASEQTDALVQARKDLDATKASLSQASSALLTRRVGLLQAQRVRVSGWQERGLRVHVDQLLGKDIQAL